ncbi:hypothetical protein H0H92_008591, partial [Tricholoma furcatifolium]
LNARDDLRKRFEEPVSIHLSQIPGLPGTRTIEDETSGAPSNTISQVESKKGTESGGEKVTRWADLRLTAA